jgi:hypothetical protein
MEYYSTTKNNEIVSFAGKWTELEIIILIESSSKKPNITYFHWYVESKPKMMMITIVMRL